MKIPNSAWRAGYCVAVALLAGCASGGSQSPLAPTTTSQSTVHGPLTGAASTLSTMSAALGNPKPDFSKSWMSARAKKSRLVYVSDAGAGAVYAFSPNGTLMGTLTGFGQPEGMCADKKQNVYVANTNYANVLEYAHGGTMPIATYSTPYEFPSGCSVNGRNGNLAVANRISSSGGAGSVWVFTSPSSTPKEYAVANQQTVFFLGYDNEGNLVTSGQSASYAPQLDELNRGGSSFHPLTVSGATMHYPGTVQYKDGWAIGDQNSQGSTDYSVLYQATISGSTLTVSGTTKLASSFAAAQCWLYGSHVIAPDPQSADADLYTYPTGGTAIQVFGGLIQPFGATFSD